MAGTHPTRQAPSTARRGGVPIWLILCAMLLLQAAVVVVGWAGLK